MPCKPFSFALQVDPPSEDKEVVFQLNKVCKHDDTVAWKLHFELNLVETDGTTSPIVKLTLDINDADNDLAAATAVNGLDDSQRAQADIAVAMAASGTAMAMVKQQVAAVLASRGL